MTANPAPPPRPRQRKIAKWSAIGAAALLVVYTLVGFLGVPWLIETYGARRLGEVLRRPVRIGQAAFNPFAFTLRIEALAIAETDGRPLVSLAELSADLALAASLGGTPTLRALTLVGPEIHVIRLADGSINLSALAPAPTAGEPAASADQAAKRPPAFRLAAFSLQEGRLVFRDDTAGGFTTTVAPHHRDPGQHHHVARRGGRLRPRADHRGRRTAGPGRTGDAGTADGGRPLVPGRCFPGQVRPLTTGPLSASTGPRGAWTSLWPMVSPTAAPPWPNSKRPSTNWPCGPAERLPRPSRFHGWPSAAAGSTPRPRRIEIDTVALEGLSAAAVRDTDGRIDLVALMTPRDAGPAPSPAAPAPAGDPGSAWSVAVGTISVGAGPLRFSDRAGQQPAEAALERLSVDLSDVRAGGGSVAVAGIDVSLAEAVLRDPALERPLVRLPPDDRRGRSPRHGSAHGRHRTHRTGRCRGQRPPARRRIHRPGGPLRFPRPGSDPRRPRPRHPSRRRTPHRPGRSASTPWP